MPISLVLNQLEQRLVGTCYTVDGQVHHDQRLVKRHEIEQHTHTGEPYDLTLNPGSLCVFPDLCSQVANGVFSRKSIQDYFLDLDDESHNSIIFRKLLSVSSGVPESVLSLLVEEASLCTVKVARFDGLTSGFFGDKRIAIDHRFGVGAPYVYVHGPDNAAIKEASWIEFADFRQWFAEHPLPNRYRIL